MSEKKIALISRVGWEEVLCREIDREFPDVKPVIESPGCVLCKYSRDLRDSELIFAVCTILDVHEIECESVKEITDSLGRIADQYLDSVSMPWCIDIKTPGYFSIDDKYYSDIFSRAELITEKFIERMKKFRKRTSERMIQWPNPEDLRTSVIFIQGMLTAKNRLLIGITQGKKFGSKEFYPKQMISHGNLIPFDEKAPCRSYYKLEEAMLHSGKKIMAGETCVDLGAAPGGWTWAALKRGAKVIAIDAAKLSPIMENHKNLTHLEENGYSYIPTEKTDWLFCDMIVKPLATLGLLERWLEKGLVDKFVVNVKFRGKEPESILDAINALKKKFSLDNLIIKHLIYDKNEITLIYS
ncbi:MAG: hypothetical protein HQM10_23705 [Candidatus Riflebacteria bacterium]|nr:hypothetical protein [Candidatus Riflebacteria bacterium]